MLALKMRDGVGFTRFRRVYVGTQPKYLPLRRLIMRNLQVDQSIVLPAGTDLELIVHTVNYVVVSAFHFEARRNRLQL